MATVVMADDGIAFDGAMAAKGPLGGAETAFVALAEALAARGHRVEARTRCGAALEHKDVSWAPLAAGVPERCDLYIGNRGPRIIGLSGPRQRLLWLHNPAGYLAKPRNAWRLAWYRPTLVTTGDYHASTIPAWLVAGGSTIIPYGILDRFRHAKLRDPPPPHAIFTSNPLRGLDWLLDLWADRIRPAVPGAELHIYAGPAVYGGAAAKHANAMEAVLGRADAMQSDGVRRFEPIGRDALIEALTAARAMLYRGDPGETFCLALGEAQALGLPAVVTPLGSVGERVADGVTGRVADSDDAFVDAAIAVLRDDALWRRWHRAALAQQRGLSWDEVAARYEAMLP
ncbi:MAG: glycosyltransferase family 4 protein [Alphaproteobacteria bacterium]|nr:glycosyltransferase family 4 protein [Alphaproteobacteria bacterium]